MQLDYQNISKKLNRNKNKVIFGGTFSANSFSVYAGYKTLEYISKNKDFYKKLVNKCNFRKLMILLLRMISIHGYSLTP